LNLFMMNHSPDGFGFAAPREQYATLEDLLDGLVLPVAGKPPTIYIFQIGAKPSLEAETQARLMESLGEICTVPIQLTENCTMVSLVGHEYLQQPGVYLDVLTTLNQAQIAALQTTDSEFSLSILVPEVDTERAVRELHRKFGLSDVK
jgi:aspartate kinase